ncbi:excalibur calcium-binding domain-containing protein [Synechocystis sp. PCC 7509]|uniref:excalibur calcium-binding domain-containing protein n=1 Tax=Synechocystis sp. PCC 7509 TaxID=927677 RepID=UPI00130EC17B|nr:excalibur calcium-binding domain-containing protein [Synechocystis sp. PCC 7509]
MIYGGIVLLSLSGCGASPPENTTVAPTPTTSASASPTPAASPSPKPSPSPVVTKTTSPKPSLQKTEALKKAEPVTRTPKLTVVKDEPAEAPPKKSRKRSSSGAKCSDFATQAEAKAALSANPRLDNDKDGIPCESLPKG